MAGIIRPLSNWGDDIMNNRNDSSDVLLFVQDLSKKYRGSSTYAIENVSFNVNRGELTAITGPNGAGKSTILGIISSAVKATSGEIRYNGSSLLKSPKVARRITASMPQWYAPIRGVNVFEALTTAAIIRGVPKAEAKKRAVDYLEQVGIGEYATTSSEKLSGGLQRLVSFGMTALQPTELYLFDEPTNDIDATRRLKIWQLMKQLANQGRAVIVVTHDMRHTTQYVDRFMVLESGELALDVTPDVLTSLVSRLVVRFPNFALPKTLDENINQWQRKDADNSLYYLVPKTQFSQVSELYQEALVSYPDLDLEVSSVTFDLIYCDLLQHCEGGAL